MNIYFEALNASGLALGLAMFMHKMEQELAIKTPFRSLWERMTTLGPFNNGFRSSGQDKLFIISGQIFITNNNDQ